ncbi:MAG TPA: ATP-dependent helicase HrpB [Gemmatimonadales bacterium]|nr:ATP-dependent helicase HrpB [Gemmatimonadales bacterium]
MLPVEQVLDEIHLALSHQRAAVLEAPPGAGKTTRVPVALLDAPWCRDQRVILLEPRRLAARAAARRIAHERGEPIGQTIGFRVRGESVSGPDTRLMVVTEGVLTRMLQDDPSLPGIAAVVFDEFHERSLHADLGLALVLGATRVLRDDLRVLVMSATLDGQRIASLLDNAPRITSAGRQFPVEYRYDPPASRQPLAGHVATVVREALYTTSGSLLVFLPGAADIHRVGDMLADRVPPDVDVRPLFGALSSREQDAAIAPAPTGRRKVVLATNVAETSITIEGITVVVDSGLERTPRFNPRTGMSRLETVRITHASADQRAGRAGRTAPGIAIRCWSIADHAGLIPHARAAILDADLAPLALDLAVAGFPDPAELPWLDPPPPAHYATACQLLHDLGAVDAQGRITDEGTGMAAWGVHPRLAHLLARAAAVGSGTLRRAAFLAALAEERDILRGDGRPPPSDLRLRLDLLERDADTGLMAGATVDRGSIVAVREQAARLMARTPRSSPDERDMVDAGLLAAWAWPDRVARHRATAGRFVMRSGRGARLDLSDPLAHAEWIVAIEVDDAGRDGRVQRAIALDRDDAVGLIEREATTETVVEWDPVLATVTIRRVVTLGAIVVREDPLDRADPELVSRALLEGIRQVGIEALPWSDAARMLRARLAFLHYHDPTWPDVSNAALEATLATWLLPSLMGMRRLDDLRRIDLGARLLDLVSWSQRAELETLAPERIAVPSGSRVAIAYADPTAPVLAVRLQEVFGMRESPRLLGGRVPVVMHLLSPARRPVQVTRDLASFWTSGYFEVRKDLRGRYPRHHWPEDPLTAEAQSGVKRRR